MSIPREILGELVIQEAKLCISLKRRSRVHCRWNLFSQLFWMSQTLMDYDVKCDKVPLFPDNERAIKITDNPMEHSRTKHIDIRHHFLWDHVAREVKYSMLASRRNLSISLPSYLMKQDLMS